MLRSIITIEKSILKNYFKEYKLPWELIRNLKEIINKIDKSHYNEIKLNA